LPHVEKIFLRHDIAMRGVLVIAMRGVLAIATRGILAIATRLGSHCHAWSLIDIATREIISTQGYCVIQYLAWLNAELG